MCFAPQRRALFRHLNFEKWSEPLVFLKFWFGNIFRTTTVCIFRHLNFQKWSDHGVLYILTSKCASRHNGVHFFDIATSKSGPRMVCFVHFYLEMCFAPQRRAIVHLSSAQMASHAPLWRAYFSTRWCHKSSGRTQCFATFLPFHAPASSFFWLFLFSSLLWIFPPLLFHLSILSEVWLLNFVR